MLISFFVHPDIAQLSGSISTKSKLRLCDKRYVWCHWYRLIERSKLFWYFHFCFVATAPNGKQIQLHIEAFSLEESNGCGFDSLEIRNGQSDKSPLMGTFCGTDILPRFKSFSNHIFLRFKTDSSNELGGEKIIFSSHGINSFSIRHFFFIKF